MKFFLFIKEISKNPYFNNLIWSALQKVVFLLSLTIIVVFYARFLGPEKLGLISYAQTYVTLFVFIVTLGLESILVREIVNNPSKAQSIISTSFVMSLIASLVAFSLVLLSCLLFDLGKEEEVLIYLASITLFSKAFLIFISYFQAIVDIKRISIYSIIIDLVLLASKITVVLVGGSIFDLILADVIGFSVLSLCFLYIYQTEKPSSRLFVFDKQLAKSILTDSWPLMVSSGAIVLYSKIDLLIIKELLPIAQLGNYAALVRVSEFWYFLPLIIVNTLFPYILVAKNQGIEQYKIKLQQLFFINLWVALPFVILISIFSREIILLLFGPLYEEAIAALSIHALSGIFITLGYVNGKWIVSENHTVFYLCTQISGLIFNIFLNLLLIPIYGIVGAAISTLVSLFIFSNLIFLFFSRTRNLFLLPYLSVFNFGLIRSLFSLVKLK